MRYLRALQADRSLRRASTVRGLVVLRAATAPERPAFIEGASGRTVAWEDVRRAAAEWTARRRALAPSSRAAVGILIADPLAAATAYLAALASGVGIAPLDPHAPASQSAREVVTLQLSAVVTDTTDPATIDALTGAGADVWRLDDDGPTPLVGRAGPAPRPLPDRAAVILASSGTTGPRKVIPLTERQLLRSAAATVSHHQLDADDRGYCPLPLFHVNAIVVGVLSNLVAGSSLVLDTRFSRRRFWSVVERYNVTWLNLVPAMIGILSESTAPSPDVQQRVRFARSASAPLAATVSARFEAHCGITVLETYGMTEAAAQITANPIDPARRRRGSVGQPVATEVRVVTGGPGNAGRRVLGRGGVGDIEIRGDSVVARYWVSTAGGLVARSAVSAGRWLATGDVGWLDDDDFLHLVGRSDDVINRAGEKIYPGEIEDVLLGDPRVTGAAAVGRPHPIVGEEPVAFVTTDVPSASRAELTRDLGSSCEQALSRFKRPVHITVAEALPSGPTGKVRRRDLRRLVAAAAAPASVPTQPPEER
ncbi:MAG: AMP-binding protein [Actinomycetota bacterium]|nr:AMP-binding protein [Actinomycetota bacterium]